MKTVKEIFKTISTLKAQTAKRRAMIQECLVAAGWYALKDRNTDPAIRLFDAVGNETNRKAMGAWIRKMEIVPIHFEGNDPKLSDAKQKEIGETVTEQEYLAQVSLVPNWWEIEPEANTAEKGWDSAAFAKDVADYLAKKAKQAGKHDDALKALIADAEILLRAHLNKDYEVVEVDA